MRRWTTAHPEDGHRDAGLFDALYRAHYSRWVPTTLRDDAIVIGDHAETIADVLTALSKLTPNDREILMLVAWDGLDPSFCASLLGCTKATFAVRLHRARKRLDKTLGPADEGEA